MRKRRRVEKKTGGAHLAQTATPRTIMAEAFLRDNPGLRPFVLSNVQLTGTRIGGGAYGKVEEVVVPMGAAAKMKSTLH